MESPFCNHNPETVVFCHLNYHWAGKGLKVKVDDFAGFYGCSRCHDWYDGRANSLKEVGLKMEYAFMATIRTWRRLLDKGVLK